MLFDTEYDSFIHRRPQNTPDAVAHLCRVTSTTHLVVHSTLAHKGRDALSQLQNVTLLNIANRSTYLDTSRQPVKYARDFREDAELTAVIMHTSGSTNMPKVSPILLYPERSADYCV